MYPDQIDITLQYLIQEIETQGYMEVPNGLYALLLEKQGYKVKVEPTTPSYKYPTGNIYFVATVEYAREKDYLKVYSSTPSSL